MEGKSSAEKSLFCGSLVSSKGRLWIPKTEIVAAGFALDSLPLLKVQEQFRCAKCGARGAERHHWAPKHLFGESAESWPTDYLCVSCHSDWHSVVTPDMANNA